MGLEWTLDVVLGVVGIFLGFSHWFVGWSYWTIPLGVIIVVIAIWMFIKK